MVSKYKQFSLFQALTPATIMNIVKEEHEHAGTFLIRIDSISSSRDAYDKQKPGEGIVLDHDGSELSFD